MKQINTGKAELVAVKIPESAQLVRIKENSQGQYIQYLYLNEDGKKRIDTSDYLPKGNWKILGNPFEFTEEQWEEIVPCELIGTIAPYNMQWLYPDYERSNLDGFETTTESGHSLLRANKIYRENPYGKGMPNVVIGHKKDEVINLALLAGYQMKWQKAEANIGNWIVLIKVKE